MFQKLQTIHENMKVFLHLKPFEKVFTIKHVFGAFCGTNACSNKRTFKIKRIHSAASLS